VLGDVLLAAFGSESFPDRVSIKKVYLAFCRLSDEKKYETLLNSLNFTKGPDVPISEELESALFRLCSSGLCTVDNPDFRFLRVEPNNKKAMREVLKRHLKDSDSHTQTLDNLVNDLVKTISQLPDDNSRALLSI
jgi:hypothetical protein